MYSSIFGRRRPGSLLIRDSCGRVVAVEAGRASKVMLPLIANFSNCRYLCELEMRRGPGRRYGLPVGAKECSPFIEVPHLAFLGKHWSARNFAAFYWCTGGISCV